MADQLIIRGAREHNLKDVSLDLPARLAHRLHRAVRVGQVVAWRSTRSSPRASAATSSRCRRTPASSSARWTSPTSTSSRASRPAVSIDQKSTSKNPRSTVGTITEVYDYLRLLYARAGRPHCPTCGAPIERQTPQQIVDRVLALEEGRRFQVLAPVIRGRKGEYVELFRQLQTAGLLAAPGSTARPTRSTSPPTLDKQKKHTIEVVVDRLAVKESSKRRLTDSVETALSLAGGLVVFDFVDLDAKDPGPRAAVLARRWPAPTTTRSTPTSSSRARSRSTRPFGACPVPRPRHPDGGRPRAGRPRPAGHPRRGRDPAVEPGPRRRLLPRG